MKRIVSHRPLTWLEQAERVWKDSYSNSIDNCPIDHTTEHLIYLYLFSSVGMFS